MEPMGSFGEWKCSECGRVDDVKTELRRGPRGPFSSMHWPKGWGMVTGETFARVVCPRCHVARQAEAQ